jgi:hypothetical protein
MRSWGLRKEPAGNPRILKSLPATDFLDADEFFDLTTLRPNTQPPWPIPIWLNAFGILVDPAFFAIRNYCLCLWRHAIKLFSHQKSSVEAPVPHNVQQQTHHMTRTKFIKNLLKKRL